MAEAKKPKQRPVKAVRRDAAEGERRLWTRLRRKQVGGATFRRQYPIADVTASFACIARKTVVEFDTSKTALASEKSHEERRLKRIASLGWKIILVTHEDVFADLDAVADAIEAHLPPPIVPETTPQKDGATRPVPELDTPPDTGWQP